jgi:hypothetical protein
LDVAEQTQLRSEAASSAGIKFNTYVEWQNVRTGFNLKSLFSFLSFLAIAAAVMLFAPHALGRALTGAEFAAIVLPVGAVLARLSMLARRRQRQKVEEMRDSALW